MHLCPLWVNTPADVQASSFKGIARVYSTWAQASAIFFWHASRLGASLHHIQIVTHKAALHILQHTNKIRQCWATYEQAQNNWRLLVLRLMPSQRPVNRLPGKNASSWHRCWLFSSTQQPHAPVLRQTHSPGLLPPQAVACPPPCEHPQKLQENGQEAAGRQSPPCWQPTLSITESIPASTFSCRGGAFHLAILVPH
jgi:hypothetical protein